MIDDQPPDEATRKEIEALFGNPGAVPGRFKAWFADQFALDVPQLPISQMFGGGGIERALDSDFTVTSNVGSSTAVTLYTRTIKGKQLAQRGRLAFDMHYRMASPDGGQACTFEVRLNSTAVLTTAVTTANLDGTLMYGALSGRIFNTGTYGGQYARGMHFKPISPQTVPFQTGSEPISGSAAVDTSADFTFSIVAYWQPGSDANEIVHKDGILVTLFNPIGKD